MSVPLLPAAKATTGEVTFSDGRTDAGQSSSWLRCTTTCPSTSSSSSREEVVQLGPTGPADVEDLLDLSGALVSGLPRGEGFELDFVIDAGGDTAQVPIPGTVRQTLEQRREFCSGALLAHSFVSTELGELHLCRGSVVEIAKMGLKCLKEGCFVGEGGRRSLDPDLDGGKLGEDGGDPSSRITIEKTEGNLNLQLKGREGRVNRPGRQRERTLSATRRTKDCPRMEATVVTVCRANFARNECSSGLAAATAVKTIEEAWRRGDIGQGLKSRRGLWTMSWPKNAMECRGARPWEVFPTVAPRRAGGSLEGSLKAVRLPQFLEGDGDLLVLDLYWRQVGGCGCLERQVETGQGVPECRATGVLDSSDWHVAPFIGSDVLKFVRDPKRERSTKIYHVCLTSVKRVRNIQDGSRKVCEVLQTMPNTVACARHNLKFQHTPSSAKPSPSASLTFTWRIPGSGLCRAPIPGLRFVAVIDLPASLLRGFDNRGSSGSRPGAIVENSAFSASMVPRLWLWMARAKSARYYKQCQIRWHALATISSSNMMDRGVRLGHGCRLQMKKGARFSLLSGSSQETSTCSWVSKGIVKVCTTRPMGEERAAEAGLYTWGDKGRLCALVHAQLVRAQHADAAPGAIDKDLSV
ncbi:predicted protein [Postia placenta Mad-698-R]|nr:predicted protein [Postia placenta Mad-698-R]